MMLRERGSVIVSSIRGLIGSFSLLLRFSPFSLWRSTSQIDILRDVVGISQYRADLWSGRRRLFSEYTRRGLTRLRRQLKRDDGHRWSSPYATHNSYTFRRSC